MRRDGREFIVGIVFFLLLGALGAITLQLGSDVLLSTEEVVFRFHDVAGLTEGSEVWINGLPSGTVKSVTISPDGTVLAMAKMKNKFRELDLSKGVAVEVKEKSSLGGTVVSVSTLKEEDSRSRGAPRSLEEVQGRTWSARPGGFASVGQGAVTELVKSAEEKPAFLGKALLGEKGMADLEESLAELKAALKDVRGWIRDADQEDSALAVLLKDKETGRKLRTTIANLEEITGKAKDPQGLLGKLLSDTETAEKFDRVLEDLQAFTSGMNDREGSLYKILHEPALYDDARAAVADVRKFTEGINNPDGLLHRLVNDRKLADDVSETVSSARLTLDELRAVVADVRAGKGTLGRLVTDETLYTDLKSTIGTLRRSFEESRENAPILTFAGFLFRAF